MKAFLVLVLTASAISAGDVGLDSAIPVSGGRVDVLQYDDGIAEWGVFAEYKGVWFSLADFSPYAIDFYCDQLEFWMHDGTGVGWWDSEIWTGGPEGPESLLVSISTVGYSMQPAYATFDPPIQCGESFWVVMDCESMGSGRPSTFADGTPNPVDHSFISWDGQVWEPSTPGSSASAVDFFFRVYGTLQLDLDEGSWGSIKTLF